MITYKIAITYDTHRWNFERKRFYEGPDDPFFCEFATIHDEFLLETYVERHFELNKHLQLHFTIFFYIDNQPADYLDGFTFFIPKMKQNTQGKNHHIRIGYLIGISMGLFYLKRLKQLQT